MRDPEGALAWQLAAAGIAHERQYRYAPGRRLAADFALPEARLLVEVQGGIWTGGAHGSKQGILRDLERLNAATLAGWWLLRVLPEWCALEDGRAFALVLEALAALEARRAPAL